MHRIRSFPILPVIMTLFWNIMYSIISGNNFFMYRISWLFWMFELEATDCTHVHKSHTNIEVYASEVRNKYTLHIIYILPSHYTSLVCIIIGTRI